MDTRRRCPRSLSSWTRKSSTLADPMFFKRSLSSRMALRHGPFLCGLARTASRGLTLALLASAGLLTGATALQQVGDTTFQPTIADPAFEAGQGPRVVIDEAHFNFHTVDGRYQSFARVLRADGFVVEASDQLFSERTLANADLLVISNALNARNQTDWSLPTPSAFTTSEIDAVHTWVERGGALLLIADHMPFPGAAEAMAAAFDFELNNGFAVDTTDGSPFVFRVSDGTLGTHPVVRGRSPAERVDSVATFTGEAFLAPPGSVSLLTLREGIVSLMPEVAWEFGPDTRTVEVGGWVQGSVMEVGRGRLAVFGEAAMFSAQRQGPESNPMGMNAPVAGQNVQFLVNLVRWLSDVR